MLILLSIQNLVELSMNDGLENIAEDGHIVFYSFVKCHHWIDMTLVQQSLWTTHPYAHPSCEVPRTMPLPPLGSLTTPAIIRASRHPSEITNSSLSLLSHSILLLVHM